MESIQHAPRTLPAALNTTQVTVGILSKISKCAQSALNFIAALYNAAPKGLTVLKKSVSFCSNFLILLQICNTIEAVIKIKKNIEPLKRNREKLNLWVSRQNSTAFPSADGNSPDLKKTLYPIWFKPEDEPTPCQKEKFDIFINACHSISKNLTSGTNPISSEDAAKAYINVKCRKLRSKIRQLKLEQIKYVSSIACDISEIALTISTIAAAVGIITLATPSLPILFIALIVACLAVNKKVFKTLHKKSCKTIQLRGLEAAIVNEYKHNKIPHRFNCLQHSYL